MDAVGNKEEPLLLVGMIFLSECGVSDRSLPDDVFTSSIFIPIRLLFQLIYIHVNIANEVTDGFVK